MILPTANGVAKLQSTSQSKAKQDKSHVSAQNYLQTVPDYFFTQSSCP